METWNETLAERVRTGSSKSANGSSCYFVQLTPETGIKLYGTELERDASRLALSVASERGLAPKVGQCVDLKDVSIPHALRPRWWPDSFQPQTLYGFLTEVVRPIDKETDLERLRDDLSDLFEQYVSDIAYGNVGYTQDGTLVAIDLDGRFTGLLTVDDVKSINTQWGGTGKNFWG